MVRVSAHRSPHRSDRPQYPDIAEAIGEDPARYLHQLDETTFAGIRGIVDEDVLDAWFEVEVELGPRKKVIAALNARRAALETGGGSA